MSRELVLYLARPLERAAARAWRITLGSLGQLRSATQDGPGWLKDRYGEEERRRLQAYAEAHVDVLCALLSRRSK
jgi:hypothetical protein